MKINREGYIIIISSLSFFAVVSTLLYYVVARCEWCWWLTSIVTLLAVVWLFVIFFFREPSRELLVDDNLIYAPCDGQVVVTERVYETEFLDEEMMQISIFMSVANVHINWLPVSGVVDYFKHHQGRYLFAWNPKSSKLNEHTTTVIRCTTGQRVLVRQVAGYIARRIVSYVEKGDSVKQNRKLGFIKFGSRIDILIPKSAEVKVKLGDRVVGAKSVIAKF